MSNQSIRASAFLIREGAVRAVLDNEQLYYVRTQVEQIVNASETVVDAVDRVSLDTHGLILIEKQGGHIREETEYIPEEGAAGVQIGVLMIPPRLLDILGLGQDVIGGSAAAIKGTRLVTTLVGSLGAVTTLLPGRILDRRLLASTNPGEWVCPS